MRFKPLFSLIILAILILALCTVALAVEKVDTSSLKTVYTNTFDDASAIADFDQYYGTWSVVNGKLYLTAKTGTAQTFILYNGDSSLTSLTDYVVDVDMYNVQSQGGIIIPGDADRASATGDGNNFYGYLGFISFTGEKGAIGYSSTSGGWGGNLIAGKNVTVPGTNIHLQLAVKGSAITLNLFDPERDRTLWSATVEDTTWTKGTFGFRLYSGTDKTFEGNTLNVLGTTAFDNLVVSVFDTPADTPEQSLAGMTFTNPVNTGADPFVLKDDDGTYYLYATTGDAFGFRVFSSKNLVEWTSHGYCLLGSWNDVYTDPNSQYQSHKRFWAPEVIKYGDKYYMTVSFQHHLNFAVADSPIGPFKTIGPDILFPGISTIDGHFFTDDDGKMYFYFVTEGAATINGQSVTTGNNIWGVEFDMDALVNDSDILFDTSEITLLVTNDTNYETGGLVVEGPFVLKHNGKYYLTFSSGGYASPHYSVHYAVSDKPVSGFKRDARNVALKCDDLFYNDTDNPHLYGTAHHAFVEAPNGRDLLIIYHCHRTNKTWSTPDNLASPRSTCIDYAWFEGEYLFAGSKENKTVPTAVAQPVLEGTVLERETYYTGEFAALTELPTVYVAATDGVDTNTGARDNPVKSVSRALALLPNGGTVVFTQNYNLGTYFNPAAKSGPLLFTSEHNNVVITFKYISFNSTVYVDNLLLAPETLNEIAVIECNFNNVVFGEGVGCVNRPYGDYSFPYLAGGRWQYGGSSGDATYKNNFKYSESDLVTSKEYTLTVLGGKWELVTEGTINYKSVLENSAPNAILERTNKDLKPAPTEVCLAVSGGKVAAGSEATVTVSVTENEGFGALDFALEFDGDAFTVRSVTLADSFDSFDVTVTDGKIEFSFEGDENVTAIGTLATVVLDTAELTAGSFPITLSASDADAFRYDGWRKRDVTVEKHGSVLTVAANADKLDVDANGSVDLLDALTVIDCIFGDSDVNADVNGDGIVSLIDVLWIFKAIAA